MKPADCLDKTDRTDAELDTLTFRAIRWNEVELNLEERKVYRNNALVRLTPREYEITELFMLHPDKIFFKEELLERFWASDYSGLH